jgi:hypothetical protein
MADLHIVEGAPVYTSDGHEVGAVTEALSDEFVVEGGGHFKKHLYLFRNDLVQQATPQRIDLKVDNDLMQGRWNTLSLRDKHGRERPVTQVGVPYTVPQYDEVQTTTGGPPDGEAENT